jgi:ANTAR domain
MAARVTSGDAAPTLAEANLGAFFRHREDVPAACRGALISSLGRLRRSDDPVVTFAGLPQACVPEFADGCQVQLSDGAGPPFVAAYPISPADGPESAADQTVGPDQVLSTPFRVVSRIGYRPYAGLVTHWWTGRTPSENDAVIAELTVRHLIALVDHEQLIAVLARAEDQAASLALQAISGRTISLATGIVMHQNGLAAGDAEDLLRRHARKTGTGLHEVAASVVASGALPEPNAGLAGRRPGAWAPGRPSSIGLTS